jgi:hypothetical protein
MPRKNPPKNEKFEEAFDSRAQILLNGHSKDAAVSSP